MTVSHGNSAEKKEKNHQLMDYVCVATSYASEQGATPKDVWCGNSRNSHTLSCPEQDRSCQDSTHVIVSDCLSSAWGKRNHATHKNDTAHAVCPKNPMPPTFLKAINKAFITKCHFIYEALSGGTCHHCSFLASPISHDSNSA